MNKPLVIITGASSGIGAALAQVFSAAGYPLGLIARNLAALQQLNLPNAICVSADVTNYDALKIAIDNIEQSLGPTDCLINNAGFVRGGDFTEIDPVDHETMVNVNLIGVMNGIEIILPHMRKRRTGTIINISSLSDRTARPHIATYAATKAALKSLSESLRMANARHNVRICNFAPAKVATQMWSGGYFDEDKPIDPQDVAKAVLWMYQQPQSICVRDLVFAPTHYEP